MFITFAGMLDINKIHNYDCIEGLRLLPDNFVDCCITSPPYWGLRDYGVDGQLGLEKTPEEYVAKMTDIFREVRRVLKKEGTLWLNLGDSYAGSGKGSNPDGTIHPSSLNGKQGTHKGTIEGTKKPQIAYEIGLKPKDLVGIPWMTAFALRADGWWLRQDIIWHKPNPMPESVTDRCTKSHEYIFLMSKSQKYYYDQEAILEDSIWAEQDHRFKDGPTAGGKTLSGQYAIDKAGAYREDGKRNKRDVWTVNTEPYKEAHFATYPQRLIIDCIKAGCPKGGIVLDPFMGSGTTAVVARKIDRNFIGFELNESYITIAEQRLYKEMGMFL